MSERDPHDTLEHIKDVYRDNVRLRRENERLRVVTDDMIERGAEALGSALVVGGGRREWVALVLRAALEAPDER